MKRIKKYLVNFSYASQALLIISFLNILKIFPYRIRIIIGSIIFRFFLSPLTGNKKRIENNLNLVLPNLPESDKKNLIKNCLHNIGMTMFELLSPHDFKLSGQKANVYSVLEALYWKKLRLTHSQLYLFQATLEIMMSLEPT